MDVSVEGIEVVGANESCLRDVRLNLPLGQLVSLLALAVQESRPSLWMCCMQSQRRYLEAASLGAHEAQVSVGGCHKRPWVPPTLALHQRPSPLRSRETWGCQRVGRSLARPVWMCRGLGVQSAQRFGHGRKTRWWVGCWISPRERVLLETPWQGGGQEARRSHAGRI